MTDAAGPLQATPTALGSAVPVAAPLPSLSSAEHDGEDQQHGQSEIAEVEDRHGDDRANRPAMAQARRWWPRVGRQATLMSDDLGPNAEGWLIFVEWFGVIVEVSVLRRDSRGLD